MFSFEMVAEVATLAALGFVGAKMFIDDRRARTREDTLASALEAAAAAKRDMVVLVAMVRKEADGLKAIVEAAANAGEEAARARTAASFEAARADSLIKELQGAVSAADRSCDRLSGLVKEAAAAGKALVGEEQPAVIEDPVPAPESKQSSKVVKLVRRGK